MKTTLFLILLALVLSACGGSMSGTYKMENILPKTVGLGLAPQQRAQIDSALDSQRVTLEFGPGKKVVVKSLGVGTEATYSTAGEKLKVIIPPNQFMEFTIQGDTLIGPGGIRYRKQ